MEEVIEEIRNQYNKFPYPSFSWVAKVNKATACHASFEAGSSIVHHKILDHENRKIALLGAGTFEPYVQGLIHPKASIFAVDLSLKSLKLAQRRCHWRKVKNVQFLEGDLLRFCELHPGEFDFITSHGVLHHLPDPAVGFKAIATALKPDGFARVMVYSETQRRRTGLIQSALKILGVKQASVGAGIKAKSLLDRLPLQHPLKLSQVTNFELNTKSGLIDSLLNAWEKPFGIKLLLQNIKEAGLHIHGWDFSANLLSLLTDAKGSTLEEKLYFLESFDQWPGPFTFWISKAPMQIEKPQFYRTNPLLRGYLTRTLPSTVLKKTLKLTSETLEVLQEGLDLSIPKSEFKMGEQFIASRFMLGVDQ